MWVSSWGVCSRGNRALIGSVLNLRKTKLHKGLDCLCLLLFLPLLLWLKLRIAGRELSISISKCNTLSLFVFSLYFIYLNLWNTCPEVSLTSLVVLCYQLHHQVSFFCLFVLFFFSLNEKFVRKNYLMIVLASLLTQEPGSGPKKKKKFGGISVNSYQMSSF